MVMAAEGGSICFFAAHNYCLFDGQTTRHAPTCATSVQVRLPLLRMPLLRWRLLPPLALLPLLLALLAL
jgi:hypothetical protein